MKGTRGEVASMTSASNNYGKEIERLIRSGLDPESEAIKKLRNEQENLKEKIKETNEVHKAQEQLMKGAEAAAGTLFAAIGAGIATMGVATQKTAEAGDQYAKTSRIIGMTAETFQELNYAAKMSGVNDLTGSLEKLNKTISDVKGGTGALTSYLKENDAQLLSQLKNVNSNEDAFMLLMDAIDKAPDEFSRAELAQAAFGKSGQELILVAKNGADGIANLREEAKKYGIISNETAANSEAFLDAQSRLKASFSGVTTELTEKLLPGLTNIINSFADFIAGIDDWSGKLDTLVYVLAGVTAGLVAFLIVAKGSAIIDVLTKAVHGLNEVLKKNMFGFIASIIITVLIPALIFLYKNWDTVQTYIQQGLIRLESGFKWLGSVIEEGLVVAFNTVKSAAATLFDFIYGNIIRGIGTMLEVMGKLPIVGDLFNAASEKVKGLGNAIGNMAEETRQASKDAIQLAHDKQDAIQQELNAQIAATDAASIARRKELDDTKKANEEIITSAVSTQDEITSITASASLDQISIVENKIKSIQERLSELPLSEQQIQNEQIKQFEAFLNQRADLEGVKNEERITWLKEQSQILLDSELVIGEERIALQKSIDELIYAEDEKLKKKQDDLMRTKLSASATFFSGLSELAGTASKESIALLITEKAAASAQAAINSYLAFTKALAEIPTPFNYVAAAGVLASGLAQQVKIISTAIPSAETGGRFIVPNSVGSDSQIMRVNPGEEIDVIPRGMTGNNGQQITVQIERDVIFNVVNDGIRSGDILIAALNY